ncbi:MAG: Gfo/Idh/MocA family oxidoreductase [Bryobacterales bacterium]|nr:Gfo/Idh/MocA family oxidoreductase [Bryobacteraceae bacterium]MDW8353889.1 Gfo/Idh/MocA family oxidoreductase [Bryobacterales bacterium]
MADAKGTVVTRREFSRGAAAATALSYSRILGANERVGIGYIGLGNRGDQVHDAFLEHGDQLTVALCDLREDYMDFAARKSRANPRKYKDYRKLLEDHDVDAVVISTPDHWHALMFIDACNAGKDVYVEKPLSLTVVEGRRMVETAERTKRVVQVGIHRRSSPFLKEAAELVRSGGIGQVTVAKSYHILNEWPNGIGNPPDEPPPSEEEWEMWLGPAPRVPYNRNRTYYNFRWFYHYSGGQLTNFGVHYIDMIRWCLGQDAPRAVTALGGKYAVRDNREIPDTLEVLWEFDGPTLVVFAQYNANAAPGNVQNAEMELRGTLGTMYIHGNRWEVVPEPVTEMARFARTPLDRRSERAYGASKQPRIEPRSRTGSQDTAFHVRNFLDCIKTRGKCNCDTLTGHLSTAATIIGNIAHKTKSYLEWDARNERFTNNETANRFLHYRYRPPYRLS